MGRIFRDYYLVAFCAMIAQKRRFLSIHYITSHFSMSNLENILQKQEIRIRERYLCINPEPEADWYETIDAIYEIANQKLYKCHFKRLDDYITGRWPGISRRTFFNLKDAGMVCAKIRESISPKDLPTNVSSCLAILKCSTKYKKPVVEVWDRVISEYSIVQARYPYGDKMMEVL